MKLRKHLALLLALLLVVGCFAGCGAQSNKTDAYAPEAAPEAAPMEPMDGGYYEEDFVEAETALSDSSADTQAAALDNQKLITTVSIEAETEDLDAMLAHVNAKISALSGYIESQDIWNGSSYSSYRYRNANLTIRIPADKLDQFVQQVSEQSNVVSKNTTTENVTLTYVATESRVKALETAEARLLELLAKAETMEDLLTIEARLTDVRTELEQVASQLRLLDNKINYSTVHLYLTEVTEYTEVEEEPETFWQRLGRNFVKSLESLGDFLLGLIVVIAVCLPYLVVFGVIGLVIFLIIRASIKKKKRRKAPPAEPAE